MADPIVDEIELAIETMANGGNGIARHDGKVVFVPYTIPGEVISGQITGGQGRVLFAEGLRLLQASGDRVFPQCQHFGLHRCGGCQWQHIGYAAQLLLKQDVLADQLERVGGLKDPAVRAVIASPQQWGYNHHMRFIPQPEGGLALRGSDGQPFTVETCEVLHPDLLDLFEQLTLEDVSGIEAMTLARGDDNRWMLTLYLTSEEEAPSILLDLPLSINLVLPTGEPVNAAGDTHLRYTVAGRSFRVTAGSAFRANVDALGGLVAEVLAALGSASNVLDLYCGVGLFGAFIAERGGQVLCVDNHPPAVLDASENTAEFANVRVIEGEVEQIAELLEGVRYEAAIVNPPESGMSIPAIDAFAALELPTLVLIGADIATFCRDLARLCKHGYSVSYVQPLDFAPQTYTLEVVAVLQRPRRRESVRKSA